ncbi:hypothetical protein EYR40_006032 [Pleurotus pulmonarius]|nr:hypothetical protein EYR40_006032 [Pleurotus pulmonarius]
MPPKNTRPRLTPKPQQSQDAEGPEVLQTTKMKRQQKEKVVSTTTSQTVNADRITRSSNKTAHPGQIIIDNKQKRRTSEQVREDEHAKAVKLIADKVVATAQFQEMIRKAAAAEDRVRQKELLERQLAERPDLADEFASFVMKRTSLTNSNQDMAVDISSDSDIEDASTFEPEIPEASVADDTSEPSISEGMVDEDLYGEDSDEEFVLDTSILDNDDVSPSDIEDKPVQKLKAKKLKDIHGTHRKEAANTKHSGRDNTLPSDIEDKPVRKPNGKKEKVSRAASIANSETPTHKNQKKYPKGTLRAAVNAKHSELDVVTGTKRKASVSHTGGSVGKEVGKRVKSEGGLRVDWRQTALQANSPATNTAVAHLSAPVSNSSRDDSTDEPEVEGEFNQDEEKAALKAARASKMTAVAAGQGSHARQASGRRTTAQMGIKLEPQGSPATVQNANTPVKPRIADLPFPRGQSGRYMPDLKVFKATIINFSGTCVDMFAAASDPEFENVVRDAWESIFPDLAQHSASKVVLAVSQGALSDHRSAMGKMALALFTKLVPTERPVAEIIAFVKEYRTPRFISRDPDAELERSLNGWKNGTNEIFDAAKLGDRKLISGLAFSSENWGSNAIGWTSGISALTEKRWNTIINEASRYVPNKQVMKTLTASADAMVAERDVRQAVVVSDDEFLE